MALETNWSASKYIQFAGRIKRMTDFDNLAKLIKEAVKVHEESYVKLDRGCGGYQLDIQQSCDKVAFNMNLNSQYTRLAYLMVYQCWNDAIDWADTQLYPIEMAYVKACYRCANGLAFGDFGDDLESSTDLMRQFTQSAGEVRKSLYGFGND